MTDREPLPARGHLRLRIGIVTGGTFTDVAAVDDAHGEVFPTKTPSAPRDPSIGALDGIRKVLRLVGGATVAAVSHGTTVATNALLQERFPGLGLVTTEGFRHVLEIARQAVPRGYGHSYFWVKPDRIVPLPPVREVPQRMTFRGQVLPPFDAVAAGQGARWFRAPGIQSTRAHFSHPY